MLIELENFEKWLNVNGCAENTRKNYTRQVTHFWGFTHGEITKAVIEDYFLNLQKGKSAKTVNCYRDAVSAFLKYKEVQICLPKRARAIKTQPNWLSKETMEDEIIPSAEMVFNNPAKVVAIIYLLFSSGLRRSEICALKRKDIDLEHRRGRVYRQKVRDWHTFLFDKKTRDKLNDYFVLEDEVDNAFNIGISGMNYIFQKLQKQDRLKGMKLHPHVFRHSLAVHLLKTGTSLKYIQSVLGHVNISETAKYVPIIDEDVEKAYRESMETKEIKKRR